MEETEEPPLLPLDLSAPRRRAHGGDRQAAHTRLPQVYFIAAGTKGQRTIVAAVLITQVLYTSSCTYFVVIGGRCVLAAPVAVPPDAATHSNGILALKPQLELQVRESIAVGGGSVNSHFTAWARTTWKAFDLDAQKVQLLLGPTRLTHLEIPGSLCMRFPGDPEQVQSLRGVIPDFQEDVQQGVGNQAASSSGPQVHGRPSPESPSSVAHHDARRAADRILSLATPRAGGTITHEYTPQTLLMALQLNGATRASTSLQDVLCKAAPFFFGSEACSSSGLLWDIRHGNLPQEQRMRDARVRVDLLHSLFERTQEDKATRWRYLNPDSSPQLGWNWLFVRQDMFVFDRDQYKTDADIASADLRGLFQSFTMKPSTIGHGAGSGLNKAFLMERLLKLQSADLDMYAKIRGEIDGITTDQGAEQGLADAHEMQAPPDHASCVSAEQLSAAGKLFPRALYMPEHIHMLYNSLQAAVEGMRNYKNYIVRLRALERFMSDKGLRRLLIAKCMDGQAPKEIWNHSSMHIDWRWEMLGKSLGKILPVFRLLADKFDLVKLTAKEDGDKLDLNTLKEQTSHYIRPHTSASYQRCCWRRAKR